MKDSRARGSTALKAPVVNGHVTQDEVALAVWPARLHFSLHSPTHITSGLISDLEHGLPLPVGHFADVPPKGALAAAGHVAGGYRPSKYSDQTAEKP